MLFHRIEGLRFSAALNLQPGRSPSLTVSNEWSAGMQRWRCHVCAAASSPHKTPRTGFLGVALTVSTGP